MKKSRLSLFFILLIITIILFCLVNGLISKPFTKKTISDFSLDIYYVSPYLYTDMPLSVEYLLDNVPCVTVTGEELEEHVDVFNKLRIEKFTSVDFESYLNARIYYVLQDKDGKKVFDVAMWSGNGNVLFNGTEVYENEIFYEAILPFLPQDKSDELIQYRGDELTVK